MTGSDRRELIVKEIHNSSSPISATKLAELFCVSRQVIVGDIALIRAAGYDIISTNRGYVINSPKILSRFIKVHHTDEQLEDELKTVVDMGGCVENVVVHHKIYGRLEAPLNINSRLKISEFMEGIKSGKSSPLKNITSNYHYHTVTADSEKTLDLIENALKEKGYFVDTK